MTYPNFALANRRLSGEPFAKARSALAPAPLSGDPYRLDGSQNIGGARGDVRLGSAPSLAPQPSLAPAPLAPSPVAATPLAPSPVAPTADVPQETIAPSGNTYGGALSSRLEALERNRAMDYALAGVIDQLILAGDKAISGKSNSTTSPEIAERKQ